MLCLAFAVVVEGKGKGGAKGNKQKSAVEEETSYDCGKPKKTARDRILSFMSVQNGSWELANATSPETRRFTLEKENYDYCMACEGVSIRDPICKTVCYQTSDCFTTIYTTSEGDTLVDKGCLYNPDDDELGCDVKEAECLAKGMTDCACLSCKTEYCNWDSSSMGLKINSLLIAGAVYFFIL